MRLKDLIIAMQLRIAWIYLKIYLAALLSIINSFPKDETPTKKDGLANVIAQMIMSRTAHLKNMAEGVQFHNSNIGSLKFLDPTIISAFTRNIFETVAMFNLVFISHHLEDQKLILYNLWMMAGLNYRQRFTEIAKSPENIKKAKDEKLYLQQLEQEVKSTNLFQSLSISDQKKIQRKINEKDYKIQFENNQVNLLYWHDLTKIMGIKEHLLTHDYTRLSLYAHPSYVSVFQFGSMFSDKKEKEQALFSLNRAFPMLAVFVADFIKLFPQAIDVFNNLNVRDQVVINFQNLFYRGDEYLINSSLNLLE